MANQTRVARNTVLAVVGIGIAGVVRVAITLVAGRLHGTEALAAISIVLSAATIASIPLASIGAAGSRYIAADAGEAQTDGSARSVRATQRGFVWVVPFTVVITATILLTADSVSGVLLVVTGSLYAAGYGWYLIEKSIFFGSGNAVRYSILEVIGFVLFVGAVGATVGGSPEMIVIPIVAWTIPFIVSGTRRMRAVGTGPFPGRFIEFATIATLGGLLSLGIAQGTVLVAERLHGVGTTAVVGASIAIISPLFLVPRALSLALSASLAYRVGSRDERSLAGEVRTTTEGLLLVAGPVVGLVMALSNPLLGLWGIEGSDGEIILKVFALAAFVTIAGVPTINRFAAQGAGALRWTLATSTVGVSLAVATWVLRAGADPNWIAWGYLIAVVGHNLPPALLAGRVVGTPVRVSPGIAFLSVVALVGGWLGTPVGWFLLGGVSVASLAIATRFLLARRT